MWQLYAVQIGIGAASAGSRYEAAFAVIIAWHQPQRRSSALLALTVVAGFASTIFMPLTGWLVDQHGWRTTLLVLTVIHAVTVPLHAVAIRRLPQPGRYPGEQQRAVTLLCRFVAQQSVVQCSHARDHPCRVRQNSLSWRSRATELTRRA